MKGVVYAGATSAVITAVVSYVVRGHVSWTMVGIWAGITVAVTTALAAHREN